MTIINLGTVERGDVVRLATKHAKGRDKLNITHLGQYTKRVGDNTYQAECFVTDRIVPDGEGGESLRFHDIEIWQGPGGTWFGECDSEDSTPDESYACKANRLGGLLCNHLAGCLMWLEEKNKVRLSFTGYCQRCGRHGVRVAYDGQDYECIDQAGCDRAVNEKLKPDTDRKDLFGDVT